jgi:hypothetical protein
VSRTCRASSWTAEPSEWRLRVARARTCRRPANVRRSARQQLAPACPTPSATRVLSPMCCLFCCGVSCPVLCGVLSGCSYGVLSFASVPVVPRVSLSLFVRRRGRGNVSLALAQQPSSRFSVARSSPCRRSRSFQSQSQFQSQCSVLSALTSIAPQFPSRCSASSTPPPRLVSCASARALLVCLCASPVTTNDGPSLPPLPWYGLSSRVRARLCPLVCRRCRCRVSRVAEPVTRPRPHHRQREVRPTE